MSLSNALSNALSGLAAASLNFRDFILHIFPSSMIGAMAENFRVKIKSRPQD